MKSIVGAALGKRFVLFGEVHGTKEIPALLTRLVPLIGPDNVFLEIPSDQQFFVNKFLRTGNKKTLSSMPFFSKPLPDGRSSKQYLDFIKSIYFLNKKLKEKIKVWCVDVPIKKFKKKTSRDRFMYEQIVKRAGKKNVFIAGNVHTSLIPVKPRNYRIITAGFLLKKRYPNKIISINLVPCKGRFYNFGIKKVKHKKACKPGLKKTSWKKTEHDYTYYFKQATPATFLGEPKNQQAFF